jgi:hypothetical protein
VKAPSRISRFLERLGERLGRSSRVFLVGLVVACGIEVAVDWNSTLFEINVLRSTLKQKGENYADLLRKAAEGPLLAYDWDELDRLSGGLFDDEDVVYVRFTDVAGNTLYDRIEPRYAKEFERRRGQPFRAWFRRPMDRDARGMLGDPLALRRKMESSRHRDFIQAFTDGEKQLFAWFSSSPPAGAVEESPRTLYQDRLADEKGERDATLSYALGAITNDQGESYGVVLVAFRHDRLARATASKLLKGLAITLFFVSLILVQNFFSRRAKLRLLDLEAALKAAREAISGTLPARPKLDGRDVGIAFTQADRVGGTVYDVRQDAAGVELLVAVPEGAGVDAAFASVVLRDLYRRVVREPGAAVDDPAELVARLLAAYDDSPLGRPVELMLVRVSPAGEVRGVVAGLRPPSIVEEGAPRAIAIGPALEVHAERLEGPLRPFAASAGDRPILIFDDGMPEDAPRRYAPSEALERMARFAGEKGHEKDAQAIADDAVAHAVKRWHKKHTDDFFALAITRSAARSSSPRAGTSA